MNQEADYDAVVESLRGLVGRRLSVSIESVDPSVTLATLIGVLTTDYPQTSPYVQEREEGVLFVLETSSELPASTFAIWRHPTGYGAKDELGVSWRVGLVAVIVSLLPEAYGYPPG